MANPDNPHGLRPICRTLSGGIPAVDLFSKAVAYATAIFQWDVVHRVADGSIEPAVSGTPGTTNWSGVSLNHGAASKATDHVVMISPDALYEAQDDNDTDGLAAADMGLNANIVAGAGSALSLISGHEIDEATAAATGTLDLHLLNKLNVIDNAFGGWCRVVVRFNKHRMAESVVGV